MSNKKLSKSNFHCHPHFSRSHLPSSVAHLTCAERLAFKPKTAERFHRAKTTHVQTLGSNNPRFDTGEWTYNQWMWPIPVQQWGPGPRWQRDQSSGVESHHPGDLFATFTVVKQGGAGNWFFNQCWGNNHRAARTHFPEHVTKRPAAGRFKMCIRSFSQSESTSWKPAVFLQTCSHSRHIRSFTRSRIMRARALSGPTSHSDTLIHFSSGRLSVPLTHTLCMYVCVGRLLKGDFAIFSL